MFVEPLPGGTHCTGELEFMGNCEPWLGHNEEAWHAKAILRILCLQQRTDILIIALNSSCSARV